MNERIQELANRATETFTTYFDGRGNVTETYFDKEKFSKLLLKDVTQFVEDKFDFCGDEIVIAEKIREHYGVEE